MKHDRLIPLVAWWLRAHSGQFAVLVRSIGAERSLSVDPLSCRKLGNTAPVIAQNGVCALLGCMFTSLYVGPKPNADVLRTITQSVMKS